MNWYFLHMIKSMKDGGGDFPFAFFVLQSTLIFKNRLVFCSSYITYLYNGTFSFLNKKSSIFSIFNFKLPIYLIHYKDKQNNLEHDPEARGGRVPARVCGLVVEADPWRQQLHAQCEHQDAAQQTLLPAAPPGCEQEAWRLCCLYSFL